MPRRRSLTQPTPSHWQDYLSVPQPAIRDKSRNHPRGHHTAHKECHRRYQARRDHLAHDFRIGRSLGAVVTPIQLGGAPIGTPVQASGIGYEPSSKISITLGGRLVWDTTANADGTFDSGFWIPDREPGLYTVTASDGHGHVGTTTLRVMAQRTKK